MVRDSRNPWTPSLQRRLPIPSILGLGAILLVTVLMLPAVAGTSIATPAQATDPPNHEVPEFQYTSTEETCDDPDGFSYAVYPAGEPISDSVAEPEVNETPTEGEGVSGAEVVFEVPSLAGGEYIFERSCEQSEYTEYRDFAFSRALLTKTIAGEGDVPEGTSFTVNVACTNSGEAFLDENREFDAAGGDAQVVFYRSGENLQCTVSEPENGGADDVTIDPGTLQYDTAPVSEGKFSDYGFSDEGSTVTNTFRAPEPEPSPTAEVDDTVEEAEPAEPVEAEPDFTG